MLSDRLSSKTPVVATIITLVRKVSNRQSEQQLRYVWKRDPADLVGDRAITVGELLDHQGPSDNPAIRTGDSPLAPRSILVRLGFGTKRTG